MASTLVISDLHLGGRFFHSVLTREEPLARLLSALDGVDRLVLLGDSVELSERRPEQAMAVAGPVLRRIGERLGPSREVIVVPGNHDFPLVRSWVRETGTGLRLDHPVPPHATPASRWMVAQLAPARVSLQYPGVWLSDRVFAMHGHYLDVHLRPISSYGVARRDVRRRAPTGRAVPQEYERARVRERSRRRAVAVDRRAHTAGATAALIRFTIASQIKALLLRPRLSPLTARVLNAQMLHCGMPAFAYACGRLGIEADWLLFGHLHRLGPLGGDSPQLWQTSGGAGVLNTGSWLWEPLLAERAKPPHGYWPGGAVLLQDGAPPRALGLLDDLTASELAP